MQATETSTGVRHDVEAIAKLLKEAGRLCWWWTGLPAWARTHFDVDGWGIDVLIGGSQKAVMIPPGLAYLSVSEQAWAAMETSKNPRFYFDLRKERKNAGQGRERLHAGGGADCRPGRGSGLHCRAGGRRFGKGPRRADPQRRGERGGDARWFGGAGLQAVFAHGAVGCGHGRCRAGRHAIRAMWSRRSRRAFVRSVPMVRAR